jgi:hypothetical protein
VSDIQHGEQALATYIQFLPCGQTVCIARELHHASANGIAARSGLRKRQALK